MLPRRADPTCTATTLIAGFLALLLGWASPSIADETQAITDNETLAPTSLFQVPNIDALILRQENTAGSLGINLDQRHRGSLVPSTIKFTARRTDWPDGAVPVRETFSPYATDDEDTLAYSISAGWGTPRDRVTFSFTTRNSDTIGSGIFLTDPQEDILSLSRTLTSNGWATTFTASLSNGLDDELGSSSQKIGASASFLRSTDWAQRIGVTARIYQDWHARPGPVEADNDTGWELRTDGDLTFGRTGTPSLNLPSLSIFFSVKGNTPDQNDADLGDVDVTTGLAGKVHF